MSEWINSFSGDDMTSLFWALGLTVALLLFILGLNRLFRWIYKKVTGLVEEKIKGLSYQGYQFFTPAATLRLVILGIKVVRFFLLLLLIYLYLLQLFNVLPWTESIYNTLFDWIAAPVQTLAIGFVNYLPKLVFIAVVFWLTRKLVGMLGFLANEVQKGKLRIPGFYPDWVKPTFNILRFFIYIMAVVLVFPYLPGSGSPAFQGVSIFLGVLFSLGSTSIIANAVGGIMIIYMRPFVIGDLVKMAGVTGRVVEKNLLVTRLSTSKHEEVTIPNFSIIGSQIINYSSTAHTEGIFLHTTVTIGYDVPWRQVHDVMLRAAANTPGVDEKPKPFVLQTALGDFSVAYELNAYTRQPDVMPRTYSLLHQNLQDAFNQAGIEVLSPTYSAVRDGNETTTPEEHRPADYRPAAFRIFDVVRGGKSPNG